MCITVLIKVLGAVCLKDFGTNSTFCGGCPSWVHKGCSGISGSLKPVPSFTCQQYSRQTKTKECKPITEVTVAKEMLEVVRSFCYLGDCLPWDGGCELTSVAIFCSSSLPLISHYLQRRSSQLVCQERHAPRKLNLGTNLIWSALPTRTKSARKISWRGCSLIIRQRYSSPVDSDGMAMWNIAMVGCRKTRNSLQWVVMAMVDLRKPVPKWSSWTDYCWTWDPKLPTGKIGLIHLEVLSDWTHPYRDYSTKVQ